MKKQNQSFRLIIVDHFDDLINQIDIKTEILLEQEAKLNKKIKLDNGTDNRRNNLNEIREKQIKQIKEIKENNLSLLNDKKTKELEEDDSLGLDKIKEKLIHFDCVLLEQPNSFNGLDLWITTVFYNQENLEFLR
jgi:hypothetical protein